MVVKSLGYSETRLFADGQGERDYQGVSNLKKACPGRESLAKHLRKSAEHGAKPQYVASLYQGW